jgi:hypothetical protein
VNNPVPACESPDMKCISLTMPEHKNWKLHKKIVFYILLTMLYCIGNFFECFICIKMCTYYCFYTSVCLIIDFLQNNHSCKKYNFDSFNKINKQKLKIKLQIILLTVFVHCLITKKFVYYTYSQAQLYFT